MGFKKKPEAGPSWVWVFIKKSKTQPGYDLVTLKLQKNPLIYSCNVNPIPNPSTSHNPILFQFTPSASCLSLTSLAHNLTHSLCLSSLTHCLTWPQAHRQSSTGSCHRQSHTVATRSQAYNSLLSQLCFVLTVANLTLSHSPLPLSSSSPMALRPRSTSISFFFFSFLGSVRLNVSLCL